MKLSLLFLILFSLYSCEKNEAQLTMEKTSQPNQQIYSQPSQQIIYLSLLPIWPDGYFTLEQAYAAAKQRKQLTQLPVVIKVLPGTYLGDLDIDEPDISIQGYGSHSFIDGKININCNPSSFGFNYDVEISNIAVRKIKALSGNVRQYNMP